MLECTAIHEVHTPKPHGPGNLAPSTSVEVQAYHGKLAMNDDSVVDTYCKVRFDVCAHGASGALKPGQRGHIELEVPGRQESLKYKLGDFYAFSISSCGPPEHVSAARQANQQATARAGAAAGQVNGDDDDDDAEDDE